MARTGAPTICGTPAYTTQVRWRRISLWAAMLVPVANTASATPPPIPFCELKPRLCHPLEGERRRHYLGLLQQAIRAAPKVPGYRCRVVRRVIGDVGYGRSVRRAAPADVFANLACLRPETDPRRPDVTIDVTVSVLPTATENGGTRDKEHDLVMFTAPNTAFLVFGRLRAWGNPQGVMPGCCSPSGGPPPEEEIVNDGPYLLSTQVRIFSESRATLDAFVRGFESGGGLRAPGSRGATSKRRPRVETDLERAAGVDNALTCANPCARAAASSSRQTQRRPRASRASTRRAGGTSQRRSTGRSPRSQAKRPRLGESRGRAARRTSATPGRTAAPAPAPDRAPRPTPPRAPRARARGERRRSSRRASRGESWPNR